MNDYLWSLAESNTDSAILYAPTVIARCEEDRNQKELAKAFSYLAVALDISGKTEAALELFLRAIRIQENMGLDKDLAFTFNNLGLLYYAQYNYDKAIQYIQESFNLDIRLRDSSSAAGSLVNLGIMETYRDNWKKSLEHYSKAEEIYKSLNDSLGIQSVLVNRAKISFAQKDYPSALKDLLESERILEKGNNYIRKSSNSIALSNVYRETGDLEKSLYYAKLSLQQSRAAGSKEREQFAYQTLYEIFEKKRDYKNAFDHLKSYSVLRDSLLNENRNSSLSEMQVKYETEKKDRLLGEEKLAREEALKQNLLLELNSEKEKQTRYILITGLLLLILLVIFMLRAYRNKQIRSQLLEEKNRLIQENLNQKVLLIGEIHHRVRNNLTLAGSLLEMQARSTADTEAKETLMESRQRIQSMALLHRYLYSDSDLYGIPMKNYLEKLIQGIRESGGKTFDNISFRIESDDTILHPDTAVPIGLIVTELVLNAGKHAFRKSSDNNEICVSFSASNDSLFLKIEDNGIGFSEGEIKKSFGSGLVAGLARQLRSEWTLNSENGTRYFFRITNFKLNEREA